MAYLGRRRGSPRPGRERRDGGLDGGVVGESEGEGSIRGDGDLAARNCAGDERGCGAPCRPGIAEAHGNEPPGPALADEIADLAPRDHLAVHEEARVFAEFLEPVQLVGADDEGRLARRDHLPQVIDELTRRFGVEARRRFVEEQELGLVDDRAADRNLLPHALAQGPGERASPVGEAQHLEELGDAAGQLRLRHPVELAPDLEVLVHSERLVEVCVGLHADPAAEAVTRLDRERFTEQFDAARRRGEYAVEEPHDRRFARAVRPEWAERAPAAHLERHVRHSLEVAEALREAGRAERGLVIDVVAVHAVVLHLGRLVPTCCNCIAAAIQIAREWAGVGHRCGRSSGRPDLFQLVPGELKRGDDGRQVPFYDLANGGCVDAKVLVDENVPETAYLRPRNMGMSFSQACREMVRSFADDLKIPFNGVLRHCGNNSVSTVQRPDVLRAPGCCFSNI